ncbi:ABC transporter permease [Lichenicola cladoniae]|nr:ABC transporter permease [Lichenicola cladoniae]
MDLTTEPLSPPDSRTIGRSRRMLQRLLEHRPAGIALLFLCSLAVLVLVGPMLSPYSFDGQDLTLIGQPAPPSRAHWLGTDELGRDLLMRLLFGGRISLAVGIASAVVSTFLGTLVGGLAGFHGRHIDQLLMRLTDVVLSIPLLPLVLLLSGLFRPDVPLLVLVIGGLTWMGAARLVRSQFLSLRTLDYVDAARALGATSLRLMLRHILPNASGPIIVSATLAVGNAIMLESALSFLGFGVQPPIPTWGNMLNAATPWIGTAAWMALPPGILIFATVLSVNFLGDGLRDALDSRSH